MGGARSIRSAILACGMGVFSAQAGLAQAPLSIIDWLETEDPAATQTDPPVTETALQPQIEVQTLDAPDAPVGIVPSSVTGLPVDLWQGSDPQVLTRLIAAAPVTEHPALQALLYSLLLTEAQGIRDDDSLLLARIDRLLDLGAIDPAKALVEAAGPASSADLFARWVDMAFLTGNEDDVCAVLADTPHLAPDRATLIFCVARRGDLNRATLLFETSLALGELREEVAPALDRFLHPELFEDAAPLPQPRDPSPLTFRLFEAIGERVPTASLPRAFAAADLRDVAGWKAQLEAAERLARTGAISSNTLLGFYTERLAAASGGVWDRVSALQRLETAIETGSADAVAKTLPDAWSRMGRAGLAVPFADLFAESLAPLGLPTGPARDRAVELMLLSPAYETLARAITPASEDEAFWLALAQGEPGAAPSPLARAIAEGFQTAPNMPQSLFGKALGETILRAIALFDRGADGNLDDLTTALTVFRALGLEDVARRASLQVLIGQEG
ncbi:hypothetical protein [Aestuariivita boseongensis]|uniref:hypothetical protein n=1 Tax=Aestuariivita boseongensis TaxID=1470562 RepID=UPI00067F8F05|nr:hypothetical protein [Aestuariivita boseongensis]